MADSCYAVQEQVFTVEKSETWPLNAQIGLKPKELQAVRMFKLELSFSNLVPLSHDNL